MYGVAMGSLIAPVLANLCLGYYEELWLNKYKDPSTVDILAILLVLSTMNMKLHSSLDFSIHNIITLGSLWK